MKRPTERAQRNMCNVISNTQSLVKDESDWIREGPDLAALAQGNEHGWLNTFLEDVLSTMSRKVTMVSPDAVTPPLRNAGHGILGTLRRSSLYSNQKVGRLQQLRAEGQNWRRRNRPTLLQPLRHPASYRAHDHSYYPPPRARLCAFQTSADLTS